jgi:hypothetical protein
MQNSRRTSGFAVAALLAVLVVPRLAAADEIRAHLIGYNEVPAINTDGNATFKIKVAPDRQSFDWELSFAGLTSVTQAHIHFGQPGVNGAIVIWLCANNPPITTAPAGTKACNQGSQTITGTATAANVVSVPAQGITADANGFEAILDAIHAGVAYANVHTSAHPGGEIRGPLKHH